MKEEIFALSVAGIVGAVIFIGIAVFYMVILPILTIWLNFWLLDHIFYPHTALSYVPDAIVYLVSMVECAISGMKFRITRE